MSSFKERFTKEEIRAKFEIWLKHRADNDYEFEFQSSFETFDVTAKRVNKFPIMED